MSTVTLNGFVKFSPGGYGADVLAVPLYSFYITEAEQDQIEDVSGGAVSFLRTQSSKFPELPNITIEDIFNLRKVSPVTDHQLITYDRSYISRFSQLEDGIFAYYAVGISPVLRTDGTKQVWLSLFREFVTDEETKWVLQGAEQFTHYNSSDQLSRLNFFVNFYVGNVLANDHGYTTGWANYQIDNGNLMSAVIYPLAAPAYNEYTGSLLHRFNIYNFLTDPSGYLGEQIVAIVPQLSYVEKNTEYTFSLEVQTKNGEFLRSVDNVDWYISEGTEPDPFNKIKGLSIDINTGILKVDDPTIDYFNIIAIAMDIERSATLQLAVYGNSVYGPGGISKPEGGDGTFNDGLSEDLKAELPDGTAEANSSSLGLFTRYAMNAAGVQAVGQFLYSSNLLDQINKEVMSFLYNSPVEAVISLISYPFSVSSLVGTYSKQLKFGNLQSEITAPALAGTAAQIDWGSIYLEEFWENFLDYAPHTKIDLYLPWSTGFVEIDPHECLPGSLSVVTNIEIAKGTCIHNVFGNGALIGSYSGVCGAQLPVTALDTSGKALALVTAATSGIVAAGSGVASLAAGERAANAARTTAISAGATAGQAARIAYNARIAAENVYQPVVSATSKVAAASSVAAFRTPPHIVRNGSFNGNGAGLGIQYPFIILSRPTQNVPKNYGHYYGFPSNIFTSLGACSGYTEVGSVHLDGIPCTPDERAEIDALLKGGVIF